MSDEATIIRPALPEPKPAVPFPLDALHPRLASLASAISARDKTDAALPGASIVATLAGAIGKGAVAVNAYKNKTTHANVYCVVGAPRGYGKGVCEEIAKPIRTADALLIEHWRDELRPECIVEIKAQDRIIKEIDGDAGRQKELVAAIREKERLEALRDLKPHFYSGDATSAGLRNCLLGSNEQIFCQTSEAGDAIRIMAGKFTKEGSGGDFDLWLSGYSVESWKPVRGGKDVVALSPCISILWAVQPNVIQELWGDREARERGMIARILPVLVEQDLIPYDDGTEYALPPAAVTAWGHLIDMAIRFRLEPLTFAAAPEAREAFRAYYNETVDLRNGPCHDIAGELGRWRENAIRLALGQAVADHVLDGGPLELTDAHAERGVRLMRYFGDQQIRMLSAGRKTAKRERVGKLAEILQECGGQKLAGKLADDNRFARKELEDLCTEFPTIVCMTPTTGGRGRPGYMVQLVRHGQAA